MNVQKIETSNGIIIKNTPPFDFIGMRIGQEVVVITDKYIYKGILSRYDTYLNLVIKNAEITTIDLNTSKEISKHQKNEVFVRGGAIISIT